MYPEIVLTKCGDSVFCKIAKTAKQQGHILAQRDIGLANVPKHASIWLGSIRFATEPENTGEENFEKKNYILTKITNSDHLTFLLKGTVSREKLFT